MTDLAPLKGTATLDVADFRRGLEQIKNDLRTVRDLTRTPATLTLTAKLAGLDTAQRDVQRVAQTLATAFQGAGGNARGLSEMDQAVRTLGASVRINRNLWQTQILTDEQAGRSAEQLRDKLLRLAAAEGASADAVLRATQAAAQAQRTLDQTRGDITKGGFAANAGLGILDALSRLAGPVGGAAALVGGAINAGLLNGLKAGQPKIGKGAQDIGQDVIDGLKNRLDIRSPSRVTFRLGQFASEGLALGLKANTAQVAKAGADVGRAAEAGINTGLKGLYGDKLSSSLSKSGGAFGGVAKEALNGEAALGKFALGAEAVQFVAGAAAGAVVALAAGMASAIRTAAQFEHEMQAVKAVTQATGAQFDALKAQAKDLAKNSSFNLAQIAQGQQELAKMGVSVEDMLGGATRGVVLLAQATGTDLKIAAEIGAKALNIFNLEGKDLNRVADIIASGANKTALDVNTLGTALSQVGASADASGLKLEETVALLGALADRGIEGSDAGTSLKTALERLRGGMPEVTRALGAYGVKVFDTNGAQRDMIEVFGDVIGVMDRMTDEQRAAYLQTVFGSDATRAATIAWKAGAKGVREYLDAVNEQNAAEKNAETRKDSLIGALEGLSGSWDNLKETVGNGGLPGLTTLVKGVDGLVSGFDDMLNNGDKLHRFLTGQLTPAVGGLALAFLAVRAQAVPLLAMNAWTALAAFPGLMATAITTKLIPALAGAAAAAGPLLVIAAGAGLATYVGTLYNDIANTYDKVDKANAESTQNLLNRVRALTKEGTELSRAQAKYLLAVDRAQEAQMGRVTGATIFGEQIVTTDPKEIAAANKALEESKRALDAATASAKASGKVSAKPLGPNFTVTQLNDQKKALTELSAAMQDRKFKLELDGQSDLQRQLGELRKEFEDLAVAAKKPFYVNGKLQMTPELRKALDTLNAQRGAEEANLREATTRAAVKTAEDAARAAQRVEIEAWQDGARKRAALRDLEVQDVQRQADEQAKALADSPQQAQAVQEAARRTILAKRAAWIREDQQQARENARRVQDAEQSAQDAVINSMADGLAKREAIRARDLQNLRETIAQRVEALAGDPDAQARVQQAGQREIGALFREQQQQRVQEVKDAQEQVLDARRAARDAEIALITDETQKRRAEREQEVADFKKSLKDRLDALKGFPAQQAQIIQEARRQAQAITQRYLQEDQQAAREAAQAIADAWQQAAEARRNAQDARADRVSAELDASYARQRQDARDMPLFLLDLERGYLKQKDDLRAESLARQAKRETDAIKSEFNTYLTFGVKSAQDLAARRAKYNADLQAAEDRYLAADTARMQERADRELDIAERTRQARLAIANRAIEDSQGRVQGLQGDLGLSTSDAETLRILRDISAERARQVDLIQQQLSGVIQDGVFQREVKLTAEERLALEQKLRGLKQEQRAADQRQLDAARALTGAVQDRLEAEAAFSERQARTDRDVLSARMATLGLYQRRLADLDAQIAGEGRADQREQLLQRRVQLTGQMLDLEEKIRAMPLQQAQRALDLTQARLRAQAQITGQAEDAVAAAELDLDLTRQQLALLTQKLADPDLTDEGRNALLIEQAGLLGEVAAGERRVRDAQQARVKLVQDLATAEQRLADELTRDPSAGVTNALTALTRARQNLADAERDYTRARAENDRAPTTATTERLRTATDALTSAVSTQRDALKGLAGEYGKVLSQMDGVRDSGQKLQEVLSSGKAEKINGSREIDRFFAIEKRRNANLDALIAARQSGDLQRIQAAADEFAKQEKRYRDQAALLKKNGISVNLSREDEAARVADSIDLLGIQQDREAALVEQRQLIVDQESRNVTQLGQIQRDWAASNSALGQLIRGASAGVSSDRPVYYFDGERFDSLAAVDAFQRQRQQARTAAAPTPATQPVTNTTITYSFGDINVSAPPTLNPRQIGQEIRREWENELRRNGRNCP